MPYKPRKNQSRYRSQNYPHRKVSRSEYRSMDDGDRYAFHQYGEY